MVNRLEITIRVDQARIGGIAAMSLRLAALFEEFGKGNRPELLGGHACFSDEIQGAALDPATGCWFSGHYAYWRRCCSYALSATRKPAISYPHRLIPASVPCSPGIIRFGP